jgi:wyosine [tRNA(Phe)-imidazoG37] synthetase (radical SAM superfamily)
MARQKRERVDYLTFVPDGEPTMDIHLGEEIALLKSLGIPLGVITNSSLLWSDDVRDALAQADWVSLKVDAVREPIWRAINRPHKGIRLSTILHGMLMFATTFRGKLVTETMLVEGINDTDDCVREIAMFLHQLRPFVAYLSVPTRPPAEKEIHGPNEHALIRAHQIFRETVGRVEYLIGYEGNAFAVTGDIEKDLLSIAAVHPMRQEAVQRFLARAGAPWAVVDRLMVQGDLAETMYEGQKFYLRRLKKNTAAIM